MFHMSFLFWRYRSRRRSENHHITGLRTNHTGPEAQWLRPRKSWDFDGVFAGFFYVKLLTTWPILVVSLGSQKLFYCFNWFFVKTNPNLSPWHLRLDDTGAHCNHAHVGCGILRATHLGGWVGFTSKARFWILRRRWKSMIYTCNKYRCRSTLRLSQY